MPRLISIIILSCFLFTTNAIPVSAAISYTYDQNGNMTSDGTRCFEYNEANQMSKVKNCADNKTIAEYIYDYSGKRLVKKEYENGVLKQTIYSPTDEYETKKIEGGATENTVYYKAHTEVIAKKNPDGSINYYHNDHLGSTTVLTDQAGNIIEKSAYEPYGEVKQGGTKSKYGYTGQEKDSETGLSYYDARYYDPHLQRFIQPDTLLPDVYDPQQLNRYTYANNNPLKYTDPTGHCPICVASLITGGIGLAISAVAKYIESPNDWHAIARASTEGFVLGAAAPLGAEFIGGVAIGALARTALSTGVRDVIGKSIGLLGANSAITVANNYFENRDPQYNFLPSVLTYSISDMIFTRAFSDLIPIGPGRSPNAWNPVDFGPNSTKLMQQNIFSNSLSGIIGGGINDSLNNNNLQFSIPQYTDPNTLQYNYNTNSVLNPYYKTR